MDPENSLPKELEYLDEFGKQLPEMISLGTVDLKARKLPIPSEHQLNSLYGGTLQLAWVRYSFIQSACVHSRYQPASICDNVAWPMWRLSKILNKPPILSYDGYTLNNWKRKDQGLPIKVDNLELIQTFNKDSDQAWFILIHVDIEYEAAMAIRNLREAVLAVERKDSDVVESALLDIGKSLDNIIATMKRMPEGTSPDTYYKIRPWIMSFENIAYEGVEEYGNQPQSFRGQTGAQTSIFQSLEAGLQMPQMENNELASYLQEMRNYMPQGHRQFIIDLETRSQLRKFIAFRERGLAGIYNCCVDKICDFLDMHLGYAVVYIHKKTDNPKGTGGTEFMKYLKKRLDERRKNSYLRV